MSTTDRAAIAIATRIVRDALELAQSAYARMAGDENARMLWSVLRTELEDFLNKSRRAEHASEHQQQDGTKTHHRAPGDGGPGKDGQVTG